MGRSSRPRPVYLAAKLKQIRLTLRLSQEQIVKKLNYTASPLVASQISEFENDKREPPIQVLLSYSRLAGFPLELLVDDEMNLPESFINQF